MAVSVSPAPLARAMVARTPTPMANSGALTSHVTDVVMPTLAEACAPIRPTMAESANCTTVCSACSTTVGQDSATISPTIPLLFPLIRVPPFFSLFRKHVQYSTASAALTSGQKKRAPAARVAGRQAPCVVLGSETLYAKGFSPL